MNKQIEIEDMAFDLCRIDTCKHLPQAECHNTTCAHCEAEALYNAGYRKSQDVAREIFEEIEKCLHTVNYPFINADGCLTPIQAPYLAIYPNDFAELKKKYESEGATDE